MAEAWKNRLGSQQMPVLVWAGKRGHESGKWFDALNHLQQQGQFQLRESVSDKELTALYQCADALIFPSHSEGFGMPLLEAMACGTPVVAADTTSLSEVVGDGGFCLSLDAAEDWAEKIGSILNNQAFRDAAIQRALHRAQSFSWHNTAVETAKAYDWAVKIRG